MSIKNFCLTILFNSIFLNLGLAKDLAFDKAFAIVKEGYSTNDKKMLDSGIKMLETSANNGNAESAFNLGALYHAPQFADEIKSCYWTIKAAKFNYVNAYFGAASCEMKANRGGDKIATMEKYAMPWIVKITKEANSEDRAAAQQTLSEWHQAKKELANEKNSGRPVRLGDLFTAFGINSISTPSQASRNSNDIGDKKMYVCKVYCKSASGPVTFQEVSAHSKGEAAKWADNNADAICRNDGKKFASSNRFSENQCSVK